MYKLCSYDVVCVCVCVWGGGPPPPPWHNVCMSLCGDVCVRCQVPACWYFCVRVKEVLVCYYYPLGLCKGKVAFVID